MRTDVATILVGMGFVPLTDFIATQTTPTNVDLIWKSVQPQPTPAQIDAFALANPNAYEIKLTENSRADAVSSLTVSHSSLAKLYRAMRTLIVNEINTLLSAVARPVTSITRVTTTATVTTPTAHGMLTGQSLVIVGADVAAYNGQKTITVTGATTFTYAVAGSPATPATGSIFYILAAAAPPLVRTTAQADTALQNIINGGTVD